MAICNYIVGMWFVVWLINVIIPFGLDDYFSYYSIPVFVVTLVYNIGFSRQLNEKAEELRNRGKTYDLEITTQTQQFQHLETQHKTQLEYLSNELFKAKEIISFYSGESVFGNTLTFRTVPTIYENNLDTVNRIHNALVEGLDVHHPNISATFKSHRDEYTYTTTLDSCTCKDFQTRKIPCKHMYFLLMSTISTPPIEREALGNQLFQLSTLLNDIKKEKELITKVKNTIRQTAPILCDLYAEYEFSRDTQLATNLKEKSNPAVKAAEQVTAIAGEKRLLTATCKGLEHQIKVYEDLFPWLLEFKELPLQEAYKYAKSSLYDDDEYSNLKQWLSPEEYERLQSHEKYQLALDRYKNTKHKTSWQVGIDFERYVGYQYENQGYKVKYSGALLGLEDMGRDLLAFKDNKAYIIQCKRWAESKTIHEKHIFQLYGSSVLFGIDHPNIQVTPVFVTTATLSDTAKQCAEFLNITVLENYSYDMDYPMVKCNISKTGEKIYHLPFDLHYDRLHITLAHGDYYAQTTLDAENDGFRHSYKWNPQKITT